jgi:hypothetical protein
MEPRVVDVLVDSYSARVVALVKMVEALWG